MQRASWTEAIPSSKDTKFYYRDADETIQVVNDQDDLLEAFQQFIGTGKPVKFFVAADALSASLIIKSDRLDSSMA